jgi:hypothetical protein
MPKPTAGEYGLALQNPGVWFAERFLQTAVAEQKYGTPWVVPGNFAAVCRMNSGNESWAVRCFLRDVPNVHDRYQQVSTFLESRRSEDSALIGFRYVTKGVLVRGTWHPIVIMDWVDGVGLDHAINELIEGGHDIAPLLLEWLRMDSELTALGIAHGDLQHGNVMVSRGAIKLVDYDGMFVPSLLGVAANEFGHPNYRHPKRSQGALNRDGDRFSSLLIYTALRALTLSPDLWLKHGMPDDAILFRESDLTHPRASSVFQDLHELDDDIVRLLADILIQDLAHPATLQPLNLLLQYAQNSSKQTWLSSSQPTMNEPASRSVVKASDSMRSKWWKTGPYLPPADAFRPASRTEPIADSTWLRKIKSLIGRAATNPTDGTIQMSSTGQDGYLVPASPIPSIVSNSTLQNRTSQSPLPTWVRPHLDEPTLPKPPISLHPSLTKVALGPTVEVVGNRSSYKYHLQSCRHVTNTTSPNWIVFASATVAE